MQLVTAAAPKFVVVDAVVVLVVVIVVVVREFEPISCGKVHGEGTQEHSPF